MRCSAINLGISDYDIFNPEEARYIANKEKKEKSIEIKVIPCNYTIWDHIEIKGPNITIRELINLFKLKYSIMIDFINSCNLVISSPLEDEEEDFDSTIEDLYSRKAKINIESSTSIIYVFLPFSLSPPRAIILILLIKIPSFHLSY